MIAVLNISLAALILGLGVWIVLARDAYGEEGTRTPDASAPSTTEPRP
jgi:hypothetical protein